MLVHTHRAVALLPLALIVLLGVGLWLVRDNPISLYGASVSCVVAVKLVLSLAPVQRFPAEPPALRTAVVVPMFNEDPEIIRRTLRSIDVQDHPADLAVVVDDGSTDRRAVELVRQWAAGRSWATLLEQPGNAGKRQAMGAAFAELAGQVDVWVCVDSDTVLDPAALQEGLRPLHDPTVMAVTGTVVALNASACLLARLIDLRYVNAFLCERAAYSRLGSVLCACGSLAFYRDQIVTKNLPDFLDQRFLGRPAVFGDDRRMTQYALLEGKVLLARQSVAMTAVPERVGHFARQQVRWGKSFIRESLWALRTFTPLRVAWWLTLLEVFSTAVFTSALLLALGDRLLSGYSHLDDYLLWLCLSAWARSVHAFSLTRPGTSRRVQCVSFALAPLYGLLNLLTVLPLRLYAGLTLRSGSWGTRQDGVEVAVTAP